MCLVAVLFAMSPAVAMAAEGDPDAAVADEAALDDEDLLEDEAFLDDEDLLAEDLDAQKAVVFDPLEPFNRVVFAFNDDMYVGVIRPVALGYRAVVPPEVRMCAANFFRNLAAPARMVNNLLQGKWQSSGKELLKFTINMLAGLGGIADIGAIYPELNTSPEDLGQTMASYGISPGPYLVMPLLGPSTLRDSIGNVGDSFLKPTSFLISTEPAAIGEGFDRFNRLSFILEDFDAFRGAAISPYESQRDLYMQYRKKLMAE